MDSVRKYVLIFLEVPTHLTTKWDKVHLIQSTFCCRLPPRQNPGIRIDSVALKWHCRAERCTAHSDALLVCCDTRLRNWQALIASRSRSPGHSKAQDAITGDGAASSYQPGPCSWSGDDVYTWQMLFRSDTDI